MSWHAKIMAQPSCNIFNCCQPLCSRAFAAMLIASIPTGVEYATLAVDYGQEASFQLS